MGENEQVDVRLARLEEQVRASAFALELQTTEFHRRLDELNGEAGRLKSMQANYISRETYESKHEELGRRVGLMETFKANMEGRMWIGGGIILILAAGIAVAVRLVH